MLKFTVIISCFTFISIGVYAYNCPTEKDSAIQWVNSNADSINNSDTKIITPKV